MDTNFRPGTKFAISFCAFVDLIPSSFFRICSCARFFAAIRPPKRCARGPADCALGFDLFGCRWNRLVGGAADDAGDVAFDSRCRFELCDRIGTLRLPVAASPAVRPAQRPALVDVFFANALERIERLSRFDFAHDRERRTTFPAVAIASFFVASQSHAMRRVATSKMIIASSNGTSRSQIGSGEAVCFRPSRVNRSAPAGSNGVEHAAAGAIGDLLAAAPRCSSDRAVPASC